VDVAGGTDQPTESKEGTMAIHDNEHAPSSTGEPKSELRTLADDQRAAAIPAQADGSVHDKTVTEPTIRVPVPAPGWVVIVAGTADRASAVEVPRAAFRDPALTRLLGVLDSEMSKNDD
jgi:hypothetical protein